MTTQTEAQIQYTILRSWGAHPRLRIARINTGGAKMPSGRYVHFNPPGTADIVGILAPEGRMVMIEVKTSKGKQRDAQVTMERVVTSMGGAYCVARSLQDVDAFFATLGLFRPVA